MSQQEMMTSAIHYGMRRALLDVLEDDEQKKSPVPPLEGLAALAIRHGVDDIERQLEGIHGSLSFIGFMGLVIAVSLIVLIGMLGKSMGLW